MFDENDVLDVVPLTATEMHPPELVPTELVNVLFVRLKLDVATVELDAIATDPPFVDDALFTKLLLLITNVVDVCAPDVNDSDPPF